MYTLILMSTLFASGWQGGNVVMPPISKPGYTLAECGREAEHWTRVIVHEERYANGESVIEVRQAHCRKDPGAPAGTAEEGVTMSDGVAVQ